MTWMFSYL